MMIHIESGILGENEIGRKNNFFEKFRFRQVLQTPTYIGDNIPILCPFPWAIVPII